jgi:Cu(I)/Ag(I) efflux system membrane fusion protein
MNTNRKNIWLYLGFIAASASSVLLYHARPSAMTEIHAAEMETAAMPLQSPIVHEHSDVLTSNGSDSTTIYTCPMHAHVVQDHPGTCPICGMDLVPTETSEHTGVQIDAATRQKLSVRVAVAANKRLSRTVRTHGTVALDQSAIFNMNPKFDGWIRKLHVSAVGDTVRVGDVLYEIYSPDFIVSQRDYLRLFERRIQLRQLLPDPTTVENPVVMDLTQESLRARQRLFYEDMDADNLREIESSKQPLDIVPVRAPRDGIVTAIGAREGSFANAMTSVVSLADLSRVWIDIALYPDHLRWVKDGDEVTATVNGSAMSEMTGRLRIASPLLDPQTRTATARMTVKNRGGHLRPGEYVDITVSSQPHQGLAVPRTAVMRNGDGAMVMHHTGDGHFVPTAVQTGVENTYWVEILHGLRTGDEVAVNGQFLLAAEASIQDSVGRMTSESAVQPSADHSSAGHHAH